jgi:hypothetical protein
MEPFEQLVYTNKNVKKKKKRIAVS